MATNVSYNVTDTSTGKSIALTIPTLNWNHDFAATGTSTNDVRLVNLTSPLGFEESFRYNLQNIANIYTKSGIQNADRSQQTGGSSLLISDRMKWSFIHEAETESGCCTEKDYVKPVEAHIVFQIPKDVNITREHVLFLAQRLYAGLYTAEGLDMIDRLLRGALNPLQ